MAIGGLAIWTVGHSNQPIDDFLRLLTRHRIELLADIRRFPGSRSFTQFNQDSLTESLKDEGIEYRWMENLGGRRPKSRSVEDSPNQGWRNQSFRNYADYMLTSSFRDAFSELTDLAEKRRTAIMCSESVFWRCHRRLVSDFVVASGGDVQHIFPNGEAKPHSLTNEAVIEQRNPCRIVYPPPATLFE